MRSQRGLADPQRRVGLLLLARRFGAELDADEIDEVAAALVDAFGYSWDDQTIAVPGPRVDGLSRDVFRGKRRAEILALFGL